MKYSCFCFLFKCYETSFTRETFLTVIRSSDCMEELEAVRDKVESDIAKWRSKDTGGSDGKSVCSRSFHLKTTVSVCGSTSVRKCNQCKLN